MIVGDYLRLTEDIRYGREGMGPVVAHKGDIVILAEFEDEETIICHHHVSIMKLKTTQVEPAPEKAKAVGELSTVLGEFYRNLKERDPVKAERFRKDFLSDD